jgi:hypothetical protein
MPVFVAAAVPPVEPPLAAPVGVDAPLRLADAPLDALLAVVVPVDPVAAVALPALAP